MTVQSVTKLDAATRQLREAIRLYFHDAEPLAVLTVAGAAHGLLRDLSKLTGQVRTAQTDNEALVRKGVNDAKNFLKHADLDPESLLTFNTDWTDYLLYDAIPMHMRLARELIWENIVFLIWVTAKYPMLSVLDNMAADAIYRLRREFPKLGSANVQKQTFLTVLSAGPNANERPKQP